MKILLLLGESGEKDIMENREMKIKDQQTTHE